MRIDLTDCLSFDDGYDLFEMFKSKNIFQPEDNTNTFGFGNSYTNLFSFDDKNTVILQGKDYPVISVSRLYSSKGSDGRYHAIYIWINFETGEYYIGKVNREKWNQIKNYTGSGVKFRPIFKKHKNCFIRYYLATCDSEKESEELESKIVNEDILKDPFCLNLVQGGGGVSTRPLPNERKEKQRQYMKDHPEQYQAMLEAAKNMSDFERKIRNNKTKQTMSTEEYKSMTKNRIKKWREEKPEEYLEAQKKSKEAQQDPRIKERRVKNIKKWRKENPEKAREWDEKRKKAMASPASRKKQSDSLKKWVSNNPEAFAERQKKIIETRRKNLKGVLMIDLKTGQVLKEFYTPKDAADWVKENGYTNSKNPSSTICSVCAKKIIPGHGIKKSAYGFGWEFFDKK